MAKSNSINSTLDSLILTDDSAKITLDTSNGFDTKSLGISAGGDIDSPGRGANIQLYGADHATNAGNLEIEAGVSGSLDIRTISLEPIIFTVGSNQRWEMQNNNNDLLYSSGARIKPQTGVTNQFITINGGAAGPNDGGRFMAFGNTHAFTGQLRLEAGNVAGGEIVLQTATTEKWRVINSGDFVPQSSGTLDVGSSSNPIAQVHAAAIHYSDDLVFNVGSQDRVTIKDNDFSILEVESAAQTGVASPVSQIKVPDTAGNRGGYGVATVSGGGLAGITAEVVTGGVYPNSEGILDLWYQEGNSTQRVLRGSQADGVSLYVDSVKRFELRPDRAIYHKSHDDYADSEYRRETFGHTCTGSGTETAFTLSPISNGAAWVTARLVAFDNTNNDSMWIELKSGVRRHDGGSASLIGTVVKTSDRETAATWDATFDTSGNDLRVRVTAISGVAFTGTVEYQQSLGA